MVQIQPESLICMNRVEDEKKMALSPSTILFSSPTDSGYMGGNVIIFKGPIVKDLHSHN